MDLTRTWFAGKGTQAPNIKDKYCVCHLVCSNSLIPSSPVLQYCSRACLLMVIS